MNTETIYSNIFGIVLAGGSGTRFWPLSRSQYPKQILRLFGPESMLQLTINRVLPRISQDQIAVVTSASQEDVIRLELFRKEWNEIKLWLEPEARNTAPAVALAAIMMGNGASSDIMAVFPADHFIKDQTSFLKALDIGVTLAQKGYLVIFGVTPTRPETGYGYIKTGDPLDKKSSSFSVEKFIEKPRLELAESFLKEGNYYWNSGIFIFRRDAFLNSLSKHLPELYKKLAPFMESELSPETLQQVYKTLPNISLDHGIIEKADNVAVIPVDMGWNDVGTWTALFDLFPTDDRGNVILGQVMDQDSRNSLIMSQDRLVATIGLKDTIVVDTADATLVCDKNRVQEVKNLVAEISQKNRIESVLHPTVERPWGSYTIIKTEEGFQVKQLVVNPGNRLSLQLHRHRFEHWVVVQGTALVTVGSEIKEVASNESIFIPVETPHRLENPGSEPLRIIEVQTGSYLGEDDIVRLDDDFWRKAINQPS